MQAVTIGNEQIAAFRRDGVIVLRGVFRDWMAPLRDGFEQVLAAPGPFAIENVGNNERGRFFEDYCNWQRIEPFSRFIHQSPAAAGGGCWAGCGAGCWAGCWAVAECAAAAAA